MATQNGWPSDLTRSVGERIKHHRKARKWSTRVLAEKCSEFGVPTPRDLINDLELGRRGHISLAELLVIAAALGVPPVELAFGGEDGSETEVLPGRNTDLLSAAHWFAGTTVLDPDAPAFAARRPTHLGEVTDVALFAQHDELATEVRQSVARLRSLGGDQFVATHAGITEGRLQQVRGEMRHRGLALPDLGDLAYIES